MIFFSFSVILKTKQPFLGKFKTEWNSLHELKGKMGDNSPVYIYCLNLARQWTNPSLHIHVHVVYFACCKIEYLLESHIVQTYLQTQVEKCFGGTFFHFHKTSTSAEKMLRSSRILQLLWCDFFCIWKISEYAEMCNSVCNFPVHVLCLCQNYGGISIFNLIKVVILNWRKIRGCYLSKFCVYFK